MGTPRRPRKRSARALAATLSLVLLVSACSSVGYSEERAEGTVAWVVNSPGGGEDAGVGGALEYMEDLDCFVLDHVIPVFFPSGTWIVDGERHLIEIPGIGVVGPGDTVEGSGGYHDLPPDTMSPDCLGPTREVAFLQRS